MPFYEYRCNDCGHEFEAMQKMSDAPLRDCPECGHAALVKLVSAPGFRLKGTAPPVSRPYRVPSTSDAPPCGASCFINPAYQVAGSIVTRNLLCVPTIVAKSMPNSSIRP